jgi:hypothetical protein
MKLKLNKQNVTALSSKDMSNVNGGGQGWSNFRSGNCRYSTHHAVTGVIVDPETGKSGAVMLGCSIDNVVYKEGAI